MDKSNLEVVILRGIPGSGKSTYAAELIAKGYMRINKDDIRQMLNNYDMNPEDEAIIHYVQMSIIRILIKRGKNMVIDNRHTKTKYIKELISFVHDRQAESGRDYAIRIKVLFPPLEECKRRNLLRERQVPEDVIDRMYEQLYNSGIEDKFLMASDWPTLIN